MIGICNLGVFSQNIQFTYYPLKEVISEEPIDASELYTEIQSFQVHYNSNQKVNVLCIESSSLSDQFLEEVDSLLNQLDTDQSTTLLLSNSNQNVEEVKSTLLKLLSIFQKE